MGLGNSSGRFTYVNIKAGKLVVKKDQETVYFDYLEGKLTGIEIRDEEYDGIPYKKLCLIISDGADDFNMQMRLDSGYGRAFCNIIMNANLSERMRLQPTYSEDDGKKKSGMFISQNGVALKWYFTKATPHDLPPMEKINFRGQDHWDNAKQTAYYIDMLLNKIRPNLSGLPIDRPHAPAVVDAASITEPLDDLPF